MWSVSFDVITAPLHVCEDQLCVCVREIHFISGKVDEGQLSVRSVHIV